MCACGGWAGRKREEEGSGRLGSTGPWRTGLGVVPHTATLLPSLSHPEDGRNSWKNHIVVLPSKRTKPSVGQ